MKTCNGQQMVWWSDKCSTTGCGHMLASHRDVSVVEDPAVPNEMTLFPFGECSLCVMHNELTASIAAQNTALRTYAESMRNEAKTFAGALRDATKIYVDGKVSVLSRADIDNQTAAKTYVDTKDTQVRKDMPLWVNNRFVAIVKPEALKVDPTL